VRRIQSARGLAHSTTLPRGFGVRRCSAALVKAWCSHCPVRSRLGRILRACCPNRFPLRMWGRHSCLPVPGTFQSPVSASNCQLWSAKLENFATGRLESPPYHSGNMPSSCARPCLRVTRASRPVLALVFGNRPKIDQHISPERCECSGLLAFWGGKEPPFPCRFRPRCRSGAVGHCICLGNTRLEAALTGSQDGCLHEVAARFPACQSGRHLAANRQCSITPLSFSQSKTRPTANCTDCTDAASEGAEGRSLCSPIP
jgi:hypothetical protein